MSTGKWGMMCINVQNIFIFVVGREGLHSSFYSYFFSGREGKGTQPPEGE